MTLPTPIVPTDAKPIREALAGDVLRTAPEPAKAWLLQALASVTGAEAETHLERLYAAAARRMRGVAFHPSAVIAERIGTGPQWDAPRAARTALLLASLDSVRAGRRAGLVDRLFRRGDNAERIALLGALAWLPTPEVYLATAVDACRTNVVSVFEAIACDNDYAALYFSDQSFNQMVLKALFLGVAVLRIRGLDRRRNDELVRMAIGYADERHAAGRSVPDDISRVVGPSVRQAE